MMLAKRFLITTADERSWKFDGPVLFLGEWCLLYTRKHVWEGMDAVVAEPYGLKAGQKERDLAYVHDLSKRLLSELTGVLNTFHNTSHNERYWNIVLGYWLQRYVAVTFNRYFTLKQALKNHEVSGTRVFSAPGYSLATSDSTAFIWACSDDTWNHVLYSRILAFLGGVPADTDTESVAGLKGFAYKRNEAPGHKPSLKRLIQSTILGVLPKFSKKSDAVIVSSFLPLIEEAKLQISLGQCPQLWRSPPAGEVAPVQEARQRFKVDAEHHAGFERFVRMHLNEMIPTCYLEGYSQLVRQAESLPWPSKPAFIFTSNNFDTDEIFKVWAGAKVEDGRLYFTGQHGSNYGTLSGSQNWPELVICDRFFTWGWTNGSARNVPAFLFKTAGVRAPKYQPKGGLLLIELHPPHRFGPEDSYAEFGVYQEEQFRFVEGLPPAIQQALTVRLHHNYRDFRWSDEQRWKDRSPNTKIETFRLPLQDLIAQSRLIVHSYDSSGILETLALNIPTMCFWHDVLGHLLPSARPYYDLLRGANILFDTPEQASEFIASHWDDIGTWWNSQKVQDARQAFCDQYARTEKKPVQTMKRLLTEHANQGNCK